MNLFDVFGALMNETAASRQREGVAVKLVRRGQVLVFDEEQEVRLADLPDAPPGFVVTGFEPYELE